FLFEQERIAELVYLSTPPGHLLDIELIERCIVALLGVEPERSTGRAPVFVLPEPRDEDRDVFAASGLGLAPLLVKEIADAVGGALQNDLGAGLVRDRLQHAGGVGIGMRPERDLGSMKELNGRRAPHTFGAGSADLVARVELVEVELLCVRGPCRRAFRIRAVQMEALNDFEPVLGRLTL